VGGLRYCAVADGFSLRMGRGRAHELLYYMYRLRDNLTIKADVSDSQLRFDKECSFRVYLYNTLSQPFWNAKLEVLSDQFEATVVRRGIYRAGAARFARHLPRLSTDVHSRTRRWPTGSSMSGAPRHSTATT